MRLVLVALLVVVAGAFSHAADPAPSTIDQLIERILDIRKQRAELDRQEVAAQAELKAELKKQQDKLDKLNPPGPGPKPPGPPADPLTAKLKAAFDDDPAQLDRRREHAKNLAALYRAAADLANDPEVPDSGTLLKRVQDAATALLKDPKPTPENPAPRKNLADVRKVANAELAALLPTDDTLTASQRAAIAELFKKLAGILDSLGG